MVDLSWLTGNKKQVPTVAGVSASDVAADTIQLVTSSIGIIPGFVGNMVVRLAIPAAERVLNGQEVEDGGDTSAAGTLLAMSKDAAAKGDAERAVDLLSRAAGLGNTEALISLAHIVEDDDCDKAVQLLERACAQGSQEAQLYLASMLYSTDRERAKALLEPLADKRYEWSAVLLAGILIEEDRNDEAEELLMDQVLGVAWRGYRTSAARGTTYLGYLNREKDPKSAKRFYKIAAKAGDTVAMCNLAVMEMKDRPSQARKLLLQAASAGSMQSYVILGNTMKGSDPLGATEFFIQAIEKKRGDAVFYLARLCGWTEDQSYRLVARTKALWEGRATAQDYLPDKPAFYPLRSIGMSIQALETQPAIRKRLEEYCGGWTLENR